MAEATTPQAGPTPDLDGLRDRFAAAALTGLLAWNPPNAAIQYEPGEAAEMAYEFADAMIAARGGRGE